MSPLLVVMAACELETSSSLPQAPVVERFIINDVVFVPGTGQGLIIREENSLRLRAEASARAGLQEVVIAARKGGNQRYETLHRCPHAPCSYLWQVSAADNGFYDFRITARDKQNNEATVNYPNSLAIGVD